MKRRGPGPHPQTQLHISWTFKDKVNPLYPNSLWIPQSELWKHILPRGGRTLKMPWWVPSPASAFPSIRLPQHLPSPKPRTQGQGPREEGEGSRRGKLTTLYSPPPAVLHTSSRAPCHTLSPVVSNGECSGEALRRSDFLHSHFGSHWAQLHTTDNPRG